MDIEIIKPEGSLPSERAYAVSMTIKSFKGRRDVDVHLFRHAWDPEEEPGMDWDSLLAAKGMDEDKSAAGSRRVILESFMAEERDELIAYLKKHYAAKLKSVFSAPIPFPVPIGLTALSDISEGKSIGFIHFERIPHFSLGFAVRGLYDLSQHRPIVETEASAG
jgi:hypothetical protein